MPAGGTKEGGESPPPIVQGFLSNVRRLRVSRDLRRGRKAESMANGLIFPYRVCPLSPMGGRGRLREPRRRLSGGKRVARAPRKIRELVTVRRDASWPEGRRVPDAIPPRKASREDSARPYQNRHRWTSREY